MKLLLVQTTTFQCLPPKTFWTPSLPTTCIFPQKRYKNLLELINIIDTTHRNAHSKLQIKFVCIFFIIGKYKSLSISADLQFARLYNYNKEKEMYPDRQEDQSIVYFTILVVIEVVVFIFTVVTRQNNLVMFHILRIIMLAGAKCFRSTSWMVQYIIFALICALLSFDPVGLWVTGHGQMRNGGQNALCVIVFLFLCIAVYVGFLFKRSFQKQIDGAFSNGYSSPPQNNIYRQPDQHQPAYANPQQGRGFHEFAGQGYSLQ